MSYLVLEAKTKKEEVIIKQFADLMKFEYKKVGLPTKGKGVSSTKEKYRKGLLNSLYEIEHQVAGKAKLQTAKDYIKEMRTATK